MQTTKLLEETVKTYNDYADEYSRKYLILKKSGKKYNDFFLANVPGKRILDIGCGPGRDVKYFLDRGFDTTGIDVVDRFVTLAERIAPGAKIKRMDLRYLDFPNDSFDGVWMKNSLIHVPKSNAPKVLKKVYNILSPGGIAYISVKLGGKEGMLEDNDNPKRKRYTVLFKVDEIRDLAEKAGFQMLNLNIVKKNFIFINLLAKKPEEEIEEV